jgi:hypothetical protein
VQPLIPFANELQTMAAGFQEKALLKFIEQQMEI